VKQGTEITFSMQIDGLVAYENELEKEFGRDRGEKESETLCEGKLLLLIIIIILLYDMFIVAFQSTLLCRYRCGGV